MKLCPGETYWSRDGRPLYCNGKLKESHQSEDVGLYRMIDLMTSQRFLSNRRGIAIHDSRLDAVTRLNPLMAIEMIAGRGTRLNY